MLRRTLLRADFRTQSVKEIARHVISKKQAQYDHVAIDVRHATAGMFRMAEELQGAERDTELARMVQKHIFGVLLRRVQPRKTLALLFDGSEPLWKLRKSRKFVNAKKFDSRFSRSCGASGMWLMEERLRHALLDSSKVAPEIIIAPPSTPGPIEGKYSAWALDLSARSDVSRNDSFCLIGSSDMWLSNLALTPFHNMTSLTLSGKDLKEVAVADVFDWLTIGDHLAKGDNITFSKLRTDITFLTVFASGHGATDLAASIMGITLRDLIDAYLDVAVNKQQFLFTEEGNDLWLNTDVLDRVLSKQTKRVGPSKEDRTCADWLEVALQTHAMLCSGGIRDYGFVPAGPPSDTTLQIRSETFLGHLRSFGAGHRIKAQSNRNFALTAAEAMLVGAPSAEHIERNVPHFTGGHGPLPGMAQDIVSAEDAPAAAAKARAMLSRVDRGTHAALTHTPSFCFVKRPGEKGPPQGWAYYGVALGHRSAAAATRAVRNAERDTDTIVAKSSKNALQEFVGMEEVDAEDDVDEEPGATGAKAPAAAAPPAEPRKVKRPVFRSVAPPFEASTTPKTLTFVTWNVQFNRHSGETTPLGRAGIDWCTPQRYGALAAVLKATDADVVGMQEVEPAWWEFLSQEPWVQENYRFSTSAEGEAINPWGVLMLIHKRLPITTFSTTNVPGYSGHANAMPAVGIQLPKSAVLNVATTHLLAPYTDNSVNNRGTQLENLCKRLEPRNVGDHCVVMADMNDYPSKFFTFPPHLRYRDAWAVVHKHTEAEQSTGGPASGHTISAANKYATLIIEPEFFGRADRIMYTSRLLEPVSASLLGTQPVREVLGITTCPEYLYPSDHFGVVCKFNVRDA